MRDIKFKGKSIKSGDWIYGHVVNLPFDAGGWDEPPSLELVCFISNQRVLSKSMEEVDPETVVEYTGLKDKKGNDIYEGDILDGSYVNPMSQETIKKHYEVVFRKATFYAELIGKHPYGTTSLYFENEKCIIIGNIYDNADLLPQAIGTNESA